MYLNIHFFCTINFKYSSNWQLNPDCSVCVQRSYSDQRYDFDLATLFTSLHTLEAVLNTSIRTLKAVPHTLLICRNNHSQASTVVAHILLLLGMHAITGCDTVNSFAGKGKLSAFQLVRHNVSFQELFARFGLSWEFSDADFKKLQMFTCTLYDAKKSESDVKTHRYQLFCSKQANIEGHTLRHCDDCLHKHCQHVYYQQLFGKEHWMLSLQFQVQLEKGGSRTKVMSQPLQLIGWKAYLLQMQYWNSCLVHACVFVKPHSISASLMDSTVQECAD